ncbi:hypothetical protein HanXRQr2_Chr08g0352651 [Helianthus annuus]|uniref:Uncharacterized protein n=1 Tax=Helianthus annuus TaxID=4232 RepID=A0A251U9M5_HELAN|nr:hypothetical protein HanXRQr2_Chr08g0352651 [Helianthus annuus]KAJ0548150.1 hypothetical protein HanIR_Chr08g0380311 [Helianthus annuus]KAJ0902736.1 hypothetical protein HanPSC8_Chr08g0340591 [Helianthus annuus]
MNHSRIVSMIGSFQKDVPYNIGCFTSCGLGLHNACCISDGKAVTAEDQDGWIKEKWDFFWDRCKELRLDPYFCVDDVGENNSEPIIRMKSATNPTEMGGNIAVTMTRSPSLSTWVPTSVCSRLIDVYDQCISLLEEFSKDPEPIDLIYVFCSTSLYRHLNCRRHHDGFTLLCVLLPLSTKWHTFE